MSERFRIAIVHRREVLATAGAAAALLAAMRSGVLAQDKPLGAGIDEAMKKVLGSAKPVDGKIDIDIPEIAENGNTVPFSLSIDSPMTAQDHVKALHIFASANPVNSVGSFHFTPASGKAAVSSRMRLARTQDIVVLAEMNDGRFIVGRRTVKVTIGGCGG